MPYYETSDGRIFTSYDRLGMRRGCISDFCFRLVVLGENNGIDGIFGD